jgi:hypothetical protein
MPRFDFADGPPLGFAPFDFAQRRRAERKRQGRISRIEPQACRRAAGETPTGRGRLPPYVKGYRGRSP